MKLSQTVFKLQSGHVSMTEINIFNVQSAITAAQENRVMNLEFLHRLMVLYICVKFHENI